MRNKWYLYNHSWIDFDGADDYKLFSPVYLLHKWFEIAAVFSSVDLVTVCLDCAQWAQQNNRLFKQKEHTMLQLLENVKSYCLWWLQAKKVRFVFGTHMWWSNPFVCLGIDWFIFIFRCWLCKFFVVCWRDCLTMLIYIIFAR